MGPLCHRLEIVDGLTSLNFDQTGELLAGGQDEIGKERTLANLDGDDALVTDVDCCLEFSLVPCLQESNPAVLFQLFTKRPQKNWPQTASRCPISLHHSLSRPAPGVP